MTGAERHCDHYDGHRYAHLDRRKYGEVEADVCIVGAGAAGGVLADICARAGLKVVVIEAGPFWDPERDFASDELSMERLGWQDTRITSGGDALEFGRNNSGRGVGGGTTHFTGVFLRFHESDFMTYTQDGVGVDWPLRYEDLAPYYDWIDQDIGVSGPRHFPWGPFRGPYPLPEREPISANAQVFRQGCEALGFRSTVAPLAIVNSPFNGRPPCINRGFCNQGCKPNSKFSTLIHHIPRAMRHGAEVLSDCMVTSLTLDRKEERVTGVVFHHEGKEYRQKARVVTDADRGFARGYTLNAHGRRPVEMAAELATKAGIWGKELYDMMGDFNFYASVTLVGEVLPDEANAVTLAEEKDEYGLARAHVHFRYGDNDNRLIAHGVATAQAILEAAGGRNPVVVPDTAHLMGGCRMGDDPETSVVDKDCRSHDVPNLFICSAAVFPTSGGANPTNTVMALAARTGHRLVELLKAGEV